MTDTTSPALDVRHVPADLPDRIRHYIDGAFVDSQDGDTFDVLEPVSNEVYVQASAGKKADIDLAVAAARRAFTDGPWPRMLPRERSRILHKIADIVESRDARLAELLAANSEFIESSKVIMAKLFTAGRFSAINASALPAALSIFATAASSLSMIGGSRSTRLRSIHSP